MKRRFYALSFKGNHTALYFVLDDAMARRHVLKLREVVFPFLAHAPELCIEPIALYLHGLDYEGCGVEHIRKMFFQGSKNRSIPCYRRLSYLIKAGYLRSLLLPALNKHFLTPGAKARLVLSQLLQGAEMKRFRIESPMLILHKLAICDIRVSLEVASKASSLFVLTHWINESALRRAPLTAEDPETKKQTNLIPDAAFTLCSHTGRKADFFLEMDMSTVSLTHMRQRVRGYLLRQDPSPVLFVVPDANRQHAIAQVALAAAKELQANPTKSGLFSESA